MDVLIPTHCSISSSGEVDVSAIQCHPERSEGSRTMGTRSFAALRMTRDVISKPMEKVLLLEIVFMACTVTTRLPKVSAFFRCAVKLCATFALIIKDTTTVGICAYFETSRIVISQHMSE